MAAFGSRRCMNNNNNNNAMTYMNTGMKGRGRQMVVLAAYSGGGGGVRGQNWYGLNVQERRVRESGEIGRLGVGTEGIMMRSGALVANRRGGCGVTKLNAIPDMVVKRKPDVEYVPPPSTADALKGVDYAIVEVGGTQLIVQEGRHYVVNHLNLEPGTKVNLNRVYGLKEGSTGKFHVGSPIVEGANVEALILQTVRAPKITVFKFKRKKHYEKKQGHRQLMSRFVVTKISNKDSSE